MTATAPLFSAAAGIFGGSMVKSLFAFFFISISLFGQFGGWIFPGGGGGAPGHVASTARLFNGTSDYMSNDVDYLGGAGTFTIAFWFQSANTNPSSQGSLWATDFGSFNVGAVYAYSFNGAYAEIEFLAEDFSGTDQRPGSQITISDTGWHHVCYRYDGTTWAYFLDGAKTVISSSITFALTFTDSNESEWMVDVNGAIARFYISTSALTDAQVEALASPCSSSGVSGTVGYWLLLGNSSPEPESSPSPNTNSLTVSGTTQTFGPVCPSQ